MTLHEYRDLEQRSDEWLALRCGMVTASAVGQLITPSTIQPAGNDTSRALTRLLVAERITGYSDPTFQSDDMFRGVMEEPRAREWYSEHCAPATECGFLIRDGLRLGNDERTFQIGCSPDGMVGDDGMLEIKAPRQKEHLRTILADEVPAQYVAQCQAALLVSGRSWLDFVSWCSAMPPFVKRVTPDPKWFEAIVAAVAVFELNAEQMVAAYRKATEGLTPIERLDLEIAI